MRIRLIASLLALTPGLLPAQSAESVKAAVASITGQDILRRIGVIAHDSMRGRNTPSPELEKTATWIAGEFRKFGLKPGGDSGRFLQRYPIVNGMIDSSSAITIAGGPTLRFGRDAVPAGLVRRANVSGRVVLLSGTRPEEASMAVADIAGAIVLIPLPAIDPSGNNSPIMQNFGMLAARRPAAVVLLTPLGDAVWNQISGRTMHPEPRPGWEAEPAEGLPIIALRKAALEPALKQKGVDLAALEAATGPVKSTPVDLTASIVLKSSAGAETSAPNVVGILEGSDPALKNEYVVFSGHMDHVGVGTPNAAGDSIFNGADDDASGTIGVVEMAEAFARLSPRPKRSLIFLTVSGEERGLWGSEYFSEHPAVPVQQIIADLNTDMIGRNWKDTIVAIGKEHSDLGTTLNRVNQAHPELKMTAIDDIWPQESFYTRSDHYNFARKGVPILFFFNGTHADYHGRDDELNKIDGEKESRILKLVFYLGLELANADQKPKWNPQSYREIVKPTP